MSSTTTPPLPLQADFLQQIVVTPGVTPSDDCPVCYEPCAEPFQTSCNHIFCVDCAKHWFTSSTTCPSCRKTLCRKPPPPPTPVVIPVRPRTPDPTFWNDDDDENWPADILPLRTEHIWVSTSMIPNMAAFPQRRQQQPYNWPISWMARDVVQMGAENFEMGAIIAAIHMVKPRGLEIEATLLIDWVDIANSIHSTLRQLSGQTVTAGFLWGRLWQALEYAEEDAEIPSYGAEYDGQASFMSDLLSVLDYVVQRYVAQARIADPQEQRRVIDGIYYDWHNIRIAEAWLEFRDIPRS